jgi:hypothetical protein
MPQWAWEEVFDETPATPDEHVHMYMIALLEAGLASEFNGDDF